MPPNAFTIVNIGNLSMNKYWDEADRVRTPSSTCTLLEVGDCRLLVDPSPWPERLEEELFRTTGLKPDAVDMVFVTHIHPDHRFGLELFPDVPWLMAAGELEAWKQGGEKHADVRDRFQQAEGRLPAGVELMPTPGHTLTHHSLALEVPWGRLVVAGDAVMTPDFWANEDGFHNTADWDVLRETLHRIRNEADFVVPGHGNYFPTTHGQE
jgi:glyoxylase-like metal-dependent hydrolase (beta-lactamase superfamily II)